MPEKPAKPARKRATPKKTTVESDQRVDHEEIARRAYFIFLEEGQSDDVANWLRAERELIAA